MVNPTVVELINIRIKQAYIKDQGEDLKLKKIQLSVADDVLLIRSTKETSLFRYFEKFPPRFNRAQTSFVFTTSTIFKWTKNRQYYLSPYGSLQLTPKAIGFIFCFFFAFLFGSVYISPYSILVRFKTSYMLYMKVPIQQSIKMHIGTHNITISITTNHEPRLLYSQSIKLRFAVLLLPRYFKYCINLNNKSKLVLGQLINWQT